MKFKVGDILKHRGGGPFKGIVLGVEFRNWNYVVTSEQCYKIRWFNKAGRINHIGVAYADKEYDVLS